MDIYDGMSPRSHEISASSSSHINTLFCVFWIIHPWRIKLFDSPSILWHKALRQDCQASSTYTANMDRHSDSNPTTTLPTVKVSRKWSEEAVRGSVQSNFYRSSTDSPAQEEHQLPPDDDTNPSLIDEWLSAQESEELSTVMYAVSNLSTPISSPVNSEDSPTFATQGGLTRPTMETLMPPGSPARPAQKNPRKRPREPTVDSTANDLLGVGAFAEGHRPR